MSHIVFVERHDPSPCNYLTDQQWKIHIQNAIRQWNEAGANFVFHERNVRPGEDPCRYSDGEVFVIMSSPEHMCPGDGPLGGVGRTEYDSGNARVYFNSRWADDYLQPSGQGWFGSRLEVVLLHEFGHVVGLGHPDEAGQSVGAVMNSAPAHDRLQRDDIEGIRALYGTQPGADPLSHIQLEGETYDGIVVLRWTDDYTLSDPNRPTYEVELSFDGINWRAELSNVGQPLHLTGLRNGRVYYFRIVANFDGKRSPPSNAIRVVVGQSVEVLPHELEEMDNSLLGVLENPSPGTIKSGVGLVSGWVCDAEELEVSFDGGPRLFVPYGSERTDTAYAPDGTAICGDTDNGFGLLMNYNNLGDGSHTVTLYADGVLVGQSQFTVKTLGTDFLRGVRGRGVITLSDGKQVTVQWEEATQGFTIIDYQPCVSQIAGACGDDG